jgi:hypothetical protein
MAKRAANHGKAWTAGEVAKLRRLSKEGTTEAAARALGRTTAAVQQHAMRTGISFRARQHAPSRKK